MFVCKADGSGTQCGLESPANVVDVCNGADDDCDGPIDEDYPLTGEQVAVYRRDGHVLLPGLASAEKVAAFRPALAAASL